MHKFVRNLITEWRRLELPQSGTVVVAVSGGADSCALLAAVNDLKVRKKLDVRIIAAHFNHGLRGDASDADAAFVGKFAAQLGTEFASAIGRIAKRGNLEQNARNARYDFLKMAAAEGNGRLVLTGHTMNDQAETFLLNLIRGSGTYGLTAMKPVRPLIEGNGEILLARPLLGWAQRQDTVAFCDTNNIDHRRDAMNDDLAFSRVRIRKTLIPLLAEWNPRIVETLSRTANLIAFSDEPGESSFTPQAVLKVSELKVLEKYELYAVLRKWLRGVRGDLRGLELQHIASIERLITSRKSGKTVELPGRQSVSKAGGSLVFADSKVEK